jgi:radical SAM protein with 4Fe4S-binding SPASM domain
MCPTGTGASSREKGFMSDETFSRVADGIRGKKAGVRFIRWGEPTLHPRLVEFVRILKNDGHLIHINTNGLLVGGKMSNDLIESGLDSIKFSFQGVDEESYHQMRQNGDFNLLLRNISRMYKIRGESPLPYIHISTTTTYESEDSIAYFKESVKDTCDLVTVGATQMDMIDTDKIKLDERKKKIAASLTAKQRTINKRFAMCPEVFAKLSIDWDGKATACCNDYDREMIVGDLRTETIGEIFSNSKMSSYREILRLRKFDKIKHCRNCYDVMS